MLACVNPGSSSSEHTLNTFRYAERLKERNNAYANLLPQNPMTPSANHAAPLLKSGSPEINPKQLPHRSMTTDMFYPSSRQQDVHIPLGEIDPMVEEEEDLLDDI